MLRDITHVQEVMAKIAVIQEHEESRYSDIPKWDGWIENYTDHAVLLKLDRQSGRNDWFPYSQLRKTEDGKSIYASYWILEQKGL